MFFYITQQMFFLMSPNIIDVLLTLLNFFLMMSSVFSKCPRCPLMISQCPLLLEKKKSQHSIEGFLNAAQPIAMFP